MTTTTLKPGRTLLALLGAAIFIDGSAGTVLAQQPASAPQATQQRTPPTQAKKPAAKPPALAQHQPPAPAQPQPAAQSQPQTVFDEHIRQGNIVRCAKTFGVLGHMISDNFSYTAQSQWDAKAGNDHAIQSLVALKPPNAPTPQPNAGIVFAAPVGSSCEGHLVQVSPVSQSCADVAATLAKSKGQNSALGDLSVSAMPNGSQVMLIPFEKACITVTVLRAKG